MWYYIYIILNDDDLFVFCFVCYTDLYVCACVCEGKKSSDDFVFVD